MSIVSIEPTIQQDTTESLNVTALIDGLNFEIGYHLYLDDSPVEIQSISLNGTIEFLVPAGFQNGLYDITVESPDGQTNTLPNAFQIGETTNIAAWELY
jgi:hypothetical protein